MASMNSTDNSLTSVAGEGASPWQTEPLDSSTSNRTLHSNILETAMQKLGGRQNGLCYMSSKFALSPSSLRRFRLVWGVNLCDTQI